MKFAEADELMKQGIPVKMPEWAGYWAREDGSIKMHCKDGRVLDIRETEDLDYTLGFIKRDEWEIADASNSKLLHGEVVETFGLGEAIRRLENCEVAGAVKIARKNWNGANQFLFYQRGFDMASTLKYGFGEYEGEPRIEDIIILKTTNNVLILGWTPTTTDLVARDYYIVK